MISLLHHALLLTTIVSAVMAGTPISVPTAGPKVCYIERFGKLHTFLDDLHSVELPCRFRLAEITCGNYEVKVTVRNEYDGRYNHRFSPSHVRVQISDGTRDYVGFSSINKIKNALEDNSNPWRAVTSDLPLGFEGLNGDVAVVKKGPAVVRLTIDRTVSVTCNSNDFSSADIDTALCGNYNTENELRKWKKAQFENNLTPAQAIHYLVLNNERIVQSTTCQGLAEVFQSCPSKEKAVSSCEEIFGKVSVASKLARDPKNSLYSAYGSCLKASCR